MTTSLRGPRGGNAHRRRADRRRALGPRQRHSSHRRSGSRATCSIASRTRRRATSARRCSTRRFRWSAPSRRSRRLRSMGDTVIREFPFAGDTGPMHSDRTEALLNRSWRPALSVVGADGLPAIAHAATCCGHAPRSSSRCACRPPSTARRRPTTSNTCSRPIRPTTRW
jgi:hypothetical protein